MGDLVPQQRQRPQNYGGKGVGSGAQHMQNLQNGAR